MELIALTPGSENAPNCQDGRAGLELPTERDGEPWSHEEHIIAFRYYNQIEFGKIHARNPKVIELALLLGRKVGSASLKLGSKGEVEVWQEFSERPDMLVLSARLLAEKLGYDVEEVAEIKESDLPPPGLEREALVKLRVNQNFFPERVLSAYEFRCLVTGLANRSLLTASHIVPWAQDPRNRLNPRNGLCLNPLHDRAFDSGLMWIDDGFRIKFSPLLHRVLSSSRHSRFALELRRQAITAPAPFLAGS